MARFCSRCGAGLPPAARFCSECGATIAPAAPTAPPAAPPLTEVEAKTAERPADAASRRQRSGGGRTSRRWLLGGAAGVAAVLVLSGLLLMSGRFGTLAGVGGPMPHGQPSPSAAGWRVLAGDRTAPGQFNFPDGIAVDAQGNLYVADTGNDRIQKLSARAVASR